MLRETTSGGLCGLVIRSEVENEMSMKFVACVYIYCNTFDKAVRVGGGESGGHVMRETTSRGLCGGTREEPSALTDFALQGLVECRALETERVRLVALRWHSSGSEVRLGLPVGL